MSDLRGVILVDKPEGCTSHDVVQRIRRAIKQKQVGHAGTLDPLASGMLPILVGEATKMSDFLMSGDKRYQVEVQLGIQTDSLDITGQVTSQKPVPALNRDEILAVLKLAEGDLNLKIPMFSAKKIDGKKLYELAREKIAIEQPSKVMSFFDIELLQVNADSFVAEVSCRKGGFIRSWAEFVGEKLKVGGCVKTLRRIKSAHLSVENAVGLQELETQVQDYVQSGKGVSLLFNSKLKASFIALKDVLQGVPTFTVQGKDLKLLKNGMISHSLSQRLIVQQKQAHKFGKPIRIKIISNETSDLLSVLEACPKSKLKIKRVFNIL